jgi:hypothetical protein
MLNEAMNGMMEEAQKLRESGALGKSSQLLDLFDYLVSQSERERSPKEADIAMSVFGRAADFDPAQDALVRVHVHRLRSKLDQHYAAAASQGLPRLAIPKGEYRVVLEQRPAITPEALESVTVAPRADRKWMFATAALALVSLLLGGSLLLREEPVGNALQDVAPWSHTLASDRTALVVVGDRFAFGERDAASAGRLIFDPAIDSKEEFDERRLLDGTFARQSFDPGGTFLPAGVSVSLRQILPVLANSDRSAIRTRLLPLSQVTPDMMRAANVIYVGHLRDLGLLHDPVFAAAGIAVADSGRALVARDGERLLAQLTMPADEEGDSSRDFGYISAFPGPSGNFYIIIAGGGDAGLMQAAEVATDPEKMSAITRAAGSGQAFEAVLNVTSLGTMNVGSRTTWAKPLDQSAIWSNADE